jgi:hypothetical protein
MTKKTPTQLEAVRARKAAEVAARMGRSRKLGEQWFELVTYFDPEQIRSFDIQQTQGHRTFIHGLIDDMTVVEVPSTMSPAKVQEYGVALGEMGIKALIVSDNVRFMKLRTCSAQECELLDEKDTSKKGHINALSSRARPKPDSDGSGSPEPSDGDSASGSDQDEVVDGHGPEAAEDSRPDS